VVPWRSVGPVSFRRTPLELVVIGILLCGGSARAADDRDPVHWDLVTVGPATDLFSLWGHTTLCASAGAFEDGACFDFGVATESDPARLSIGTLRGQALFTAIKVPTKVLLASSQFRDAWRQRIELEPDRGLELFRELEAAAEEEESYAYQPFFRNCTTEVRDRLDRALSGRLSRGADTRGGTPLRRTAEAGLTGHVLPLALLELAGGRALDRPSTAWERMALPAGLMQAVSERLSAAPSRLSTRVGAPPPTSPSAGRIVLVLITLATSVVYWLGSRQSVRPRRVLGVWLGALGLVPLIGVCSTLPSLQGNWMLAVLTPLDVILTLSDRFVLWQRRYVLLRLAVLLALAASSITGLVVQPLGVGIGVAGLPLVLWLLRRRAG